MPRFMKCLTAITALSLGITSAGINWKAVWLQEPGNNNLVRLRVGESVAYTVMGLNGADVKANLTKSPHLKMAASGPTVVAIDQRNAAFIGKRQGNAEIRITFGGAIAIAKVVVTER
ncbi:MAG TPA: hypothetical protein VFA04_26210 [Bryobacteraceae bacterium]|nr:hypothetical protein [Bryobacteraceae bacterium]